MPERLMYRHSKLATALAAAMLIAAGTTAVVVGLGSNDGQVVTKWSFAPSMPHRRSYTASAEIGGKIYVAAGMVGNTGRPLSLFERFDPAADKWTSLPQVPASFSAAAGASLGGRLYVVGGNGADPEEANGRQVFAYDVADGRWSSRAPLPAIRTNLAAVSLDGKLYALGGLDPLHATRTAFVYDPTSNRWSTAAPLPEALHALTAVAYRGKIWTIGGQNRDGTATRHVWIYDPQRNRWRAGPGVPTPLETAGAVVADDRLYVVLESTYLIYDPNRGWVRGPSLEVPRHALAVYAVQGTLYALGGCAVPQLEDSSLVEQIKVD